jgi:phosphatidate cytidylyltransferase
MSHPDPYGGEPRGWDRPEHPVALPWPEQDLDAGQWHRRPTAGPELYADPHPRPHVDPQFVAATRLIQTPDELVAILRP